MVDTIASVYALRTALGAPINAAVKFESAMADIAKVSGFDDKGLDLYGKRLRKLAVTEIPLAVNDLAALSAAAAQAGVPDADLFDFTRLTAKAAVAWEMSGAEAGEALAKIRTALGLTNDQTSAYADAVNYVSDSTAASSRDLIDFTKRVASQGEFFGFAKEQTLAFGAAMISAGAESEVAATSFRNMGRALTRGTSATKAQRGAWKRLGMDAVKVAKAMQKDAVGTTVKVIESLAKLPEHMQASVMSDLFGDEARALAPLLNNTELLRKALALTADEQKYLNSVGREFEKRAATSEYKLQRFKSQLADIGLTVGASLLPALNKLLVPMGEMALKLSDWAEAHPELIRNVIAATAAVIGFRAAVVSLKWLGLIGRGGALTMLALGFNTVGKASIGAVKAARNAIALQTALGGMAGSVTVLDRLRSSLSGVAAVASRPQKLSGLQTVTTALKAMALAVPGMATLSTALGVVGSALAAVSAPIWGAIAAGVVAVAAAGAVLYKYWDRVSSVFTGVGRAIVEQLSPAIDAVKGMFSRFKGFMREGVGDVAAYFGADIEAAKAAFDRLFDFSAVREKLSQFATWLGSFFTREVLSDDQKAQWEAYGHEAATRLIEAVKSVLSDFIGWAADFGGRIGDAISSRVTSSLDKVRRWFGASTPEVIPMQSTGDVAGDMQRALDIAKELSALRRANSATLFGLSGDEAEKLAAVEQSYRSALAALPEAAQADINAYISALAEGGDQAGAEADRIGREIVQKLNFTVMPLVDTSSIKGALADVQRLGAALREASSATVPRATPVVRATPIAGARAEGGPVEADETYLVGEKGAELFKPDRPGTIIPADETARAMGSTPSNGADRQRRASGDSAASDAVPMPSGIERSSLRETRPPSPSAGGERQTGGADRSGGDVKMTRLLADLRSFVSNPVPLQSSQPNQAPAPANITLAPTFHFAIAEGKPEEVERAVRDILRQEVRELLRGVHADAGVLG
nr:phage tail tape measure protein [Rhizobium subbaraonis]